MSGPMFSVEELARLKTIDRCIQHSEKTGAKLTNVLSSKQTRFLRVLVERLAGDTGAAPPPDWQPIETAPRGGFPPGFTGERLTTDPAWIEPPRILVFTADRRLAIVYWDWYYAKGGHGYNPHGTAWVDEAGETLSVPPSHWMPLPDPPKERQT